MSAVSLRQWSRTTSIVAGVLMALSASLGALGHWYVTTHLTDGFAVAPATVQVAPGDQPAPGHVVYGMRPQFAISAKNPKPQDVWVLCYTDAAGTRVATLGTPADPVAPPGPDH